MAVSESTEEASIPSYRTAVVGQGIMFVWSLSGETNIKNTHVDHMSPNKLSYLDVYNLVLLYLSQNLD